jgi:hypothetical protein
LEHAYHQLSFFITICNTINPWNCIAADLFFFFTCCAADAGPVASNSAVIRHQNVHEGAGVEAKPAEPQQESAEHNERGAVTSEHYAASAAFVEASYPGTLDQGSPQTSDPTHL